MRFIWALTLSLACLTSCNDIGKQRRLAISGAQRFQELYNAGFCQELYDEAAPHFQAHEMPDRWSRDCADLRSRFGDLTKFTPEESVNWPVGNVGIVWVRGPARFVKGPAEIRLDWDLKDDRPTLFDVLVKAGSDEIAIPGFTGEVRR